MTKERSDQQEAPRCCWLASADVKKKSYWKVQKALPITFRYIWRRRSVSGQLLSSVHVGSIICCSKQVVTSVGSSWIPCEAPSLHRWNNRLFWLSALPTFVNSHHSTQSEICERFVLAMAESWLTWLIYPTQDWQIWSVHWLESYRWRRYKPKWLNVIQQDLYHLITTYLSESAQQ